MADRITFEDNSIEIKGALEEAVLQFLEEAGGEMVAQIQRNTAVDTGQLKGSWRYEIDKHSCIIGSELENAIWEEFGTGEHALNHDGRSTAWSYKDKDGNWHRTTGKKPRRALHKAFVSKEAAIKEQLERILRGL